MTEQLKAEAFVRSQRPALMELTSGCRFQCGNVEWQVLHAHESALYEDYILNLNAVGCGNSRDFHKTEIEEKFKLIGHPIQLQDWLAELGKLGVLVKAYILANGLMEVEVNYGAKVAFNLNTGQPNSPDDYKNFNDITRV